MKESFKKAIKEVYRRLKDSKIRWVIIGSTNLLLQGLAVEPNDIDILTDEKGAYEIEKIFRDKSTRKVAFSSNGKIQSHYGAFKIGEVEVEIIGDLKSSTGLKPIVDLEGGIILVEVDGIKIPCMPIKKELVAYKRLERPEKLKIIENFLKDKISK